MAASVKEEDLKPEVEEFSLFDGALEDELISKASLGDSSKFLEESAADSAYRAALATPLIQVFSVSIETNLDDDRPCEIYGSIQAIEGQNTSFHLYDRCCEDAETIEKYGTLSLIGPENGCIFPFKGVTLDFGLKDRVRGVEVIKGSVTLVSTTEDDDDDDSFDKLLKVVVQGEFGIACVYYAIFQFGVLGTVEVAITEFKGGESGRFADIYGSLVAGYGNAKRYCSNDDELKYLESALLKRSSDQPLRVMAGNPITLTRSVVVVPAYSSLKVEANLWDSRGKIVGDHVEIPAYCRNFCLHDHTGYIESQYARMQVKVKFMNAYLHLYRDQNVKAKAKANEDINCNEIAKKPRVIHNEKFTLANSNAATITVDGKEYKASFQVEVFSIIIGGINDKISALSGVIIVYDGSIDYLHIYKKDESCFELLADDSFASMEGPHRAIRNSDFWISLNLKDPVQGLEVSRGALDWNVCRLERDMSWYDKRLCSVVKGKDGFAAVHYMIVFYSFRAFIEVKFFCNSPDDIPANVYGQLSAQYSGFDYSKSYQRKYYRSRLFNQPQSKSLELKTGTIIPLCKYVVAVPSGSSLLIEVDLRAIGGSIEEALLGMVEFENNMSSTRKEIKGKHYRIELCVQFTNRR